MKKVLFFEFSTLNFGGGCERNFMNLGKWFSNKSYGVSFVTGSNTFNNQYCSIARLGEHKKNISDEEVSNSFKVKSYETFDWIDLLWNTGKRKEIKKLFDEADVVISKNEIVEVLLLKFFFRTDTTKIVFGFHTPTYYSIAKTLREKIHNFLYGSFIYNWLLKGSKVRFLFLTEEARKSLSNGRDPALTIAIPNPIDIDAFYQKEYKKRDYFNIYYVGRFAEEKGIDTLMEAIELLSKQNMNMHFSFVGSGDKEIDLKALAQKYSNCFLIGFNTDVIEYYQDADLVVIPSRSESFCYVAAEAQSCGVPVVASDIPGPQDIIVNEKTGWLVEANNPELFSKSISAAYKIWNENSIAYEHIGKEARKNIIEKFEENKINQRIDQFIFPKDSVV